MSTGEVHTGGLQSASARGFGAGAVRWILPQLAVFRRHWLAWANLAWAVFVGLPWLAPVLMGAGIIGPARVIYGLYSALCHQLADRSFFIGGPQAMYSRAVLLPYLPPQGELWWRLRGFVGTPALGYKAAWSDRMVSMYGGVLIGGLIFALVRARIHPPRWWTFVLLTIPIIVDGTTHMVSDLLWAGQGFRYDNRWLGALTQQAFPVSFTVGNGLGSFNSWMRLASGLLFGLGVAWLLYPALDAVLCGVRERAPARANRPLSGPGSLSGRF